MKDFMKNSDFFQTAAVDNFSNENSIGVLNSESLVNVSYYMSERDKFKTEFNTWSKKTAQSTLEMCRVVYEAKKELGSQDFLKFCNEIGRNGTDATVRKYLKIGEKYDKFYQYAELLPNSWTSIYEITQLSSEMFEALVTTDNSLANMTGEQIKKLMGKGAEYKSKSSVTNSVNSPSVPPQTAQTLTEASDVAVDELSQNDLIDSDAASDEADLAVAAYVSSSDDTLNHSERKLVMQPTSTMLEHVASTSSSSVEVEAEEAFKPHEILIRFNSKPSDIAVMELVDSLLKIKSKYRLDFEIVPQSAFVD